MSQEPNVNQPAFAIQKLYVRDLSLEVPAGASIFLEQKQPSIDLNIQTSANGLGDDHHEITVTATVKATSDEGKTYFLVEATQAGVFLLRNFPGEQMDTIMNVNCADILFPYLREVISEATVRAGFPPVVLSPVNFAALWEQQRSGQTA